MILFSSNWEVKWIKSSCVQECVWGSARSAAMDKHRNVAHDERIAECVECNESISGKLNMRNHIKNYKKIQCNVCKITVPLNSRTAHKTTCTGAASLNPFKCNQCDYAYGRWYDLKRHKKMCDINVKMQRKDNKDKIQTVCFCLMNKCMQLKGSLCMMSSKDTGGTFCFMKNLMFPDKILFLYPPIILFKHMHTYCVVFIH